MLCGGLCRCGKVGWYALAPVLPRPAPSLTLHPPPLNKTYNSKLHYLLGYFALVGLNRLECLLGDFQVSSLVHTFV